MSINCASAQSGRDLRCSSTPYRDVVEDIGLIAKILTRRGDAQTGTSAFVYAVRVFLSAGGLFNPP